MPDAADDLVISRTAGPNDLFAITSVRKSLSGSGSLSRSGRSWLAYLGALAIDGFYRIEATISELAHAQWLAVGDTKSVRTAFRALAELEQHGIIRRDTFRIGENRLKTIIELRREKFIFWTQRPERNVIQTTTVSDNSTPLPERQNLESTNHSKTLHDPNSERLSFNSNISKKSAKTDKEGQDRENWVHPMLYTIGVVLRGADHPRLKALYCKAKAIVLGKIPDPGIRLSHWTPDRWWTMTHDEREFVARCELIPLLEQNNTPIATDCEPAAPEPVELPTPEKHSRQIDSDLDKTELSELESLNEQLYWQKINNTA